MLKKKAEVMPLTPWEKIMCLKRFIPKLSLVEVKGNGKYSNTRELREQLPWVLQKETTRGGTSGNQKMSRETSFP